MEASEIVQQQWSWLRSNVTNHAYLVPVIDAIASVPVLHSLFPFLSVGRLCFSRCTEFPYFVDVLISFRGFEYVAEATVGEGGWVDTIELGVGSAEQTVALLAARLPADYGPAVLGPADDHRRSSWTEGGWRGRAH